VVARQILGDDFPFLLTAMAITAKHRARVATARGEHAVAVEVEDIGRGPRAASWLAERAVSEQLLVHGNHRLADAARWVRVEKKTVGLEAMGDLVDAPFRDALALHAVPVKHGQQRLIVRAVEGPADHPTVLIDLRLGCGVGEARGRDAVA